MHGAMAGSAALLALTVSQASSPEIGLGNVALFGIGSMTGYGRAAQRDRAAAGGFGALAGHGPIARLRVAVGRRLHAAIKASIPSRMPWPDDQRDASGRR